MHEEGGHVHNSSMHVSMHSLFGHQALASHCSSYTVTQEPLAPHPHSLLPEPITLLPEPITLLPEPITLSLHLSLTSMASSKSLKYTKANPLERPVCRSGRQSLNTQTAMTLLCNSATSYTSPTSGGTARQDDHCSYLCSPIAQCWFGVQ